MKANGTRDISCNLSWKWSAIFYCSFSHCGYIALFRHWALNKPGGPLCYLCGNCLLGGPDPNCLLTGASSGVGCCVGKERLALGRRQKSRARSMTPH